MKTPDVALESIDPGYDMSSGHLRSTGRVTIKLRGKDALTAHKTACLLKTCPGCDISPRVADMTDAKELAQGMREGSGCDITVTRQLTDRPTTVEQHEQAALALLQEVVSRSQCDLGIKVENHIASFKPGLVPTVIITHDWKKMDESMHRIINAYIDRALEQNPDALRKAGKKIFAINKGPHGECFVTGRSDKNRSRVEETVRDLTKACKEALNIQGSSISR